jgi:disulfide oxidoreductase YuzD
MLRRVIASRLSKVWFRRDTEEYMRDLLKREYPEAEFVMVPFLGTK